MDDVDTVDTVGNATNVKVDIVGKSDDKGSSQADKTGGHRTSVGSEPDEAERMERRKMWVMLTIFAVALIVSIVLFAIFLLPEILDMLDDIGDELRKEKDSFGMVIVCALGAVFFNCLPLPGRAAWNLIVGYVYGWSGFPILVIGHCLGAVLALFGARLLWPYLEGCSTRSCCCCLFARDGRPRKPLRFLLACVEQIEDAPMKTLFLFFISPTPPTLTAYVIGAKCFKVAFYQFFLPVAATSVKLVVPIYIGTKADDLKDLITGNSGDPVDLLFTVVSIVALVVVFSYISALAYRRLQDCPQNVAKEDSKPSPQRSIARLSCCCFIILLGLAISIVNFVVLGRLTPLYDPLDIEFLSRELCVDLKLEGNTSELSSMMLNIGKISMDVPLYVHNPNPLDANAELTGTVYHGISGADIGTMLSDGVVLKARNVGWGSNDPSTTSLLKIKVEIDNPEDLGLPAGYPILGLLAGMNAAASSPAPGGSQTMCPTADPSLDQSEQNAYFQCMLGKCEDSDVVKITGLQVLSCTNTVYLVGCDADITLQYHQFPPGTLVRHLCGKACNTTGCVPPGGRRLDSLSFSGAPARYLQAGGQEAGAIDASVVIQTHLKGKASFKVLGKIAPEVQIDSMRYLRNTLNVNPTAMMAKNLAEAQGNQTLQDLMFALMAGKTQCSQQPAATGLCADTLAPLIGNHSDVIQRAGVAYCDQLGPDLKSFDEKEEAKWIYSIFFFLVSLCCIVVGTFNLCQAGIAKKPETQNTNVIPNTPSETTLAVC